MYEDRLEVLSPGGLYGAVTVDSLGEAGASSTRNRYLSELLESTPYEGGGFVAENRGTGFQLVEEELRAADMEPPVIVDRPSLFSVTLRRRGSAAASLDEARDTGRQERRVRRRYARPAARRVTSRARRSSVLGWERATSKFLMSMAARLASGLPALASASMVW